MRRSLLFIPSNNPAMLQNADVFGSDSVIFDLEDAVNVTEKDNARNLLYYYLLEHQDLNMEVVVRINGLDTPYFEDDLEKIVSDNIDCIMLPKARIEDVKKLDSLLTKLELKKQLKKQIKILPIIELAISVLEVERTKQGKEIEYARSRVAYACKAYQIDAIDTPFTDVNDNEGLKADCINCKELGLNAKAAIHPNQIDIINDSFLPSLKLIKWAQRVMIATEEANKKGIGAFSLDGKMVDKPVIERALKIIKKAERFNVL